MSALTEDKLGPVEKSPDRHVPADAYDWDAVSALEQVERLRELAIEDAVRDYRRRAGQVGTDVETGPGVGEGVMGD